MENPKRWKASYGKPSPINSRTRADLTLQKHIFKRRLNSWLKTLRFSLIKCDYMKNNIRWTPYESCSWNLLSGHKHKATKTNLWEHPQAHCCPYFHTPTLYSIFRVVEPSVGEGSLGWADERPHHTGARRSPLHLNSDIGGHKTAGIPAPPGKRLHYAHIPVPSDLKTNDHAIWMLSWNTDVVDTFFLHCF